MLLGIECRLHNLLIITPGDFQFVLLPTQIFNIDTFIFKIKDNKAAQLNFRLDSW